MQRNKTEVLTFIRSFSKFGKQVQTAFTEGCCFWFAQILKMRFPEARIIYVPEIKHFVTEISGNFYDITGNVTSKFPDVRKYDWSEYQKLRPKDAHKITNELFYCVD